MMLSRNLPLSVLSRLATRSSRAFSTKDAPSPRVFANPSELHQAVGVVLGPTEWIELSQERINLFAEATQDFQWIHTDPKRCLVESPFKSTIAHGFHTLSFSPKVMYDLMEVRNIAMMINYGTDKVRFLRPVLAGSHVRGQIEIAQVDDVREATQAVLRISFEEKSSAKMVCVADMLVRFVHLPASS